MKRKATTPSGDAPVIPPNDAEVLTVENTFQLALITLKRALKQLIAVGMFGNDPVRLKAENAFEAVRVALEQKKLALQTLVDAADALVPVCDFLNNNTRAAVDETRFLTANAGIISKRVVLLMSAERG